MLNMYLLLPRLRTYTMLSANRILKIFIIWMKLALTIAYYRQTETNLNQKYKGTNRINFTFVFMPEGHKKFLVRGLVVQILHAALDRGSRTQFSLL